MNLRSQRLPGGLPVSILLGCRGPRGLHTEQRESRLAEPQYRACYLLSLSFLNQKTRGNTVIISKSDVTLASSHQLDVSSLSIARLWQDESRSPVSFDQLLKRQQQAAPAQLLQIDAAPGAGRAAKSSDNPFQVILEMLLGITGGPDARVASDGVASGPTQLRAGGLQVMELTQTSESESCSFAASGNICLADGSARHFDVGYRVDRSEQSSHLGVAEFKDPLVLDFRESTTRMSLSGVDFDIDSDGKSERLRLPVGNSAILFDDRNHNDKADDGSELFGPQTGNGFAELAKLDGDGNGWIDGGDAAYADLKLWQIADDGKSVVRSLANAGIGALSIANVETPFAVKENGETVAQVGASGVWLGEQGGSGVVRQINFGAVRKSAPAS